MSLMVTMKLAVDLCPATGPVAITENDTFSPEHTMVLTGLTVMPIAIVSLSSIAVKVLAVIFCCCSFAMRNLKCNHFPDLRAADYQV